MENFYEIEKQIESRTTEEENYRLRNEAKFRAIKQASTYEEFKNIVQAAHLKPIKNDDVFNRSLSSKTNSSGSSNFEIKNYEISLNDIKNFNEQEIIRFWRKAKNNERFEILKRAKLQNVITSWLQLVEMSEILNALSSFKEDSDAILISEILEDYEKLNRFNLELIMLNREQKQTAKDLLQRLEQKVPKKMYMYSSLWQ